MRRVFVSFELQGSGVTRNDSFGALQLGEADLIAGAVQEIVELDLRLGARRTNHDNVAVGGLEIENVRLREPRGSRFTSLYVGEDFLRIIADRNDRASRRDPRQFRGPCGGAGGRGDR